jgi:hypothetical protein
MEVVTEVVAEEVETSACFTPQEEQEFLDV